MIDALNRRLRSWPIWPLYISSLIPPIWLLYLGVTGGLGVEPIKELEHRLGVLALQVLIASLVITPLRKFAGLNLLKFRRALGLIGFFYVLLHLLVWLVLDVQIMDQILRDIAKRPYITIGMVGFVLLIPLALTSNARAIRSLGGRWRALHKLAYPAILLGGLHYLMVVRGWQVTPMIYLAVIVLLLALRLNGAWFRKA